MVMNIASSLSLLILVLVLIFATDVVADSSTSPSPSFAAPSPEPPVHIVYTSKPENDEDPYAYHIRILTAVLGSEEAAKNALVYSYKIIPGFAAKLTPEQVAEISKQPGVLQVQPNRTYKLINSASKLHVRKGIQKLQY